MHYLLGCQSVLVPETFLRSVQTVRQRKRQRHISAASTFSSAMTLQLTLQGIHSENLSQPEIDVER